MEAAFQRLRIYQEGHAIWSLVHNRPKINIVLNKHFFKKTSSSMIKACAHIVVLAFPPTELNVLNKHHHPTGHPCY